MIFALSDLMQYVRRKGAYGSAQKDAAMGHFAVYGVVPESITEQLEPGDFIFTQRLNSILSWAVMYFTSSSVDHVAMYSGNGDVVHMTLNGAKKHRLSTLADGARVLPIRATPKAIKAALSQVDDARLDKLPINLSGISPKLPLFFVAIRLLTGYYPDRYKWQFLADFIVTAAFIDLTLWLGFGLFFALPAVILVGFGTAHNLIAYRLRRRKNGHCRVLSHPDIHYRAPFKHGGILITSPHSLAIGPWGLLPIDAFRKLFSTPSFSGKRTNDGATNDLQKIGKSVGSTIKNGDIELVSNKSEDHKKNQNQDKDEDK